MTPISQKPGVNNLNVKKNGFKALKHNTRGG